MPTLEHARTPPGSLFKWANFCLLSVFLKKKRVQESYRSTQRQVKITVQKEQRGWWERLCVQEREPVFLTPDFDRWLDESDAEQEIEEMVGFSNIW